MAGKNISSLRAAMTDLRCVRPPSAPSCGGHVVLDLQVGVIGDHLLLGSEDVAKDVGLLRKHGVTHVLTVANQLHNYKPPTANAKHLFLSIEDIPQTEMSRYFSAAFSFIDECVAAGGRILIHCVAGKSRSATILIAYLMETHNHSFETAWSLCKEKRPLINPNKGFISQLKDFEKELTRKANLDLTEPILSNE